MFDWRKQIKEIVRRAKEEQRKLKSLTDEELMTLEDNSIWQYRDDRSGGAVAASEPSPSLIKLLAVMYETDRRYIAANRFWRRWRHPQEFAKWYTWRRRHLDEHGKLVPWAALRVFGYENSVESLCEALNASEEFVRGQAAAALGDLGDDSAVPALIHALKDESSEVRRHCIVSLMQLKDERAADPLIDLLRDDDSEIRELAATALSELGCKKAVKPLIEALNSMTEEDKEKDEITIYVFSALQRLFNKTDVPLIIDALRHFGQNIVGNAVVLLRGVCDENDIPYLKSVIRDESEDVRMVAAAILATLGDDSGLVHLLDDTSEQGRRVALAAAALFAELGEQTKRRGHNTR